MTMMTATTTATMLYTQWWWWRHWQKRSPRIKIHPNYMLIVSSIWKNQWMHTHFFTHTHIQHTMKCIKIGIRNGQNVKIWWTITNYTVMTKCFMLDRNCVTNIQKWYGSGKQQFFLKTDTLKFHNNHYFFHAFGFFGIIMVFTLKVLVAF